MKELLGTMALVFTSATAWSVPSITLKPVLGGDCHAVNTKAVLQGNHVLLTARDFGVKILPGVNVALTNPAMANCIARIPLSIPAGYRVSRIEHSVQGSISKSSSASASLTVGSLISGVAVRTQVVFPYGESYGYGEAQESFEENMTHYSPDPSCRRSIILGIDLKWQALKNSVGGHVVTIPDAGPAMKVDLELVLSPC